MATMSGGEAIARTLKASGIEYVFGMAVASQSSFIVSAIQLGIRIMTVRDEKCASLMATAYSKVSGKPGICLASNPGAAHLALGLHEAYLSGNAVAAITNDPNPAGMWRPGNLDQRLLFQPITKWTLRAEAAATLPDIIRRALRVATTGSPGPVAVIVPSPMLATESDFEIPTEGESARHPALRPAPGTASIESAAGLLLEAQNPAIIAGGGVMLSRASEELIELAELLGAPVATTHIAHGTFLSTHPLSLGVMGGTVAEGSPIK